MDKVLIVEDNPVLLKILQTGMKKFEDRFTTLTASDGEEAIEILRKESISLLVTDLQMPKVDGLTLLAYMNDHHPEIPCVVMSAHGTPQIKQKISRDVLQFIEKPFEIDELVEAILPALEGDEPLGTLNGISIANFLQMIQMEQKTCLLEIEGPQDRKGYFYFEEGVLFDAVFEDSKGEEAALAIIPLDRAKIRFKNLAKGKKKISRRIEKDLMALIMDAMRLKDEAESGDGDAAPSEPNRLEALDTDLEEDFELLDLEKTGDEPSPLAEGSLEPEAEAPETPSFEISEQSVFEPQPESSEAPVPSPSPEPAKEPIPLVSRTPVPAPSSSPSGNGPDTLLAALRSIGGYRGSAVVNASGEILARNVNDTAIDLDLMGAQMVEWIRAGRKISDSSGLGFIGEAVLAADSGVLLCYPLGEGAEGVFWLLIVLEADGNRALAKLAVKKMLPSLSGALR